MATKKNIASPEAINEYIPPRLVKAKQGWYVVYYHQVKGIGWCRTRKTFNLNRIADRRRRLERAKEIMSDLDQALTDKNLHPVLEEANALSATPLIEAVNFATELKMQSPKKETRKSFKSTRDMLLRFFEKKKLHRLTIGEFRVLHAQAFLDDCLRRGISNTTFNNYRGFCTILWNTLIKREYIKNNPFHAIDKRESEEKTRRAFTPAEREIVLAEIYRKDYWLFILVLLHFLTLIRKTECYRLRFSWFNLGEGFLVLPKTATKNKRGGTVTIPDTLLSYLREERFARFPGNFLLFGKLGLPHPSISAGENTFKRRHRLILQDLQKRGLLQDITGLSLYSWKDTGVTEFAKILRPIQLRDHARWSSIDQALTYYHQDQVIDEVKKLKIKI